MLNCAQATAHRRLSTIIATFSTFPYIDTTMAISTLAATTARRTNVASTKASDGAFSAP